MKHSHHSRLTDILSVLGLATITLVFAAWLFLSAFEPNWKQEIRSWYIQSHSAMQCDMLD